jgi:hypothetical protein
MRFNVSWERTMMMFKWHKFWKRMFLNSNIRREVSSYPNYLRVVWLGQDITIQWGE